MKSIQLLLKSCWSQKLYLFILILSSFLIQYSAFLYKSQVQNMLNSLSSSYFDIIYFGSIFLISIGVYTFLNSLIKIISEKLSLKMNLYCANIALNNINQKNADFFQEHHKNITTYIYDLMNISNLIKSIFNNFNIFMSIFGGLTFLLIKIHWIIGLFILLWFVIILYFAIHYQIHLIQSTKNFISERAKFTNHISESYKNYFTFIISSNHETNQKFFETNLDNLYAKANAQNNAKIKMEIILFIGIISLFTGFLFLAFFLKQSILGVGDLTMAVTQSIEIFLSFITFFRSIGESAEEYTRFNRSVENLIENKYIDSNKFIHQFSIKNITISSKDLNFIINEKEKKILLQEQTNVILSLLKVENNTQYNIYINQKNIKDIHQQNILFEISFVNQNIEIFHESIKKNIILHYSISEERLYQIIDHVELNDFIMNNNLNEAIPNTLDEEIKIKIGLARALIKDAKVFIFDQTFSRLRKNFYNDKLKEILKNKTIIFLEAKRNDLQNIELDN